jgi:molecular chaperone GrpE
MVMDELEESKGSEGEAPQPAPAPPAAAGEEEERGARVDAAKAFFRAMYAGEEPPAASFGQPSDKEKQETSTQTACRNCEALEFSLKEAEAKTIEAETLYKRMAADFDNYRRRMERERDESVSIGVKKAAEGMMPALDDLDRAMMYLNIDTPAEKLLESFKLVSNRILQCMEQLGVKAIQAVGEPFDPRFHEPVQQIETTEFADGIVMGELRRGYMLGERVVRPALVNVASNSTGVVTSASGPAAAAAPAAAPAAAVESAPEELEHTVKTTPASEAIVELEVVQASPESTTEQAENEKVYDLGDITDV